MRWPVCKRHLNGRQKPSANMGNSAVGLVLVLLASPVLAADFTGKVVGVLDGDTTEVVHNGRPERIRLNGIDCPEKGQAYGRRAKEATSDLAFGKDVTLKRYGLDKYGRTIGDVILPNGQVLNQELVRAGLCWWYRKYAPDNATLQTLEAEARAAKVGLWRDPDPIPPWVFRRLKRGVAIDAADLPSLSGRPAL